MLIEAACLSLLSAFMRYRKYHRENMLNSIFSYFGYYLLMTEWLGCGLYILSGKINSEMITNVYIGYMDVFLSWLCIVFFIPFIFGKIRNCSKGKVEKATEAVLHLQSWCMENCGVVIAFYYFMFGEDNFSFTDAYIVLGIEILTVYVLAALFKGISGHNCESIQALCSVINFTTAITVLMSIFFVAGDPERYFGFVPMAVAIIVSCIILILLTAKKTDEDFERMLEGEFQDIKCRKYLKRSGVVAPAAALLCFELYIENDLDFYCSNITEFLFQSKDFIFCGLRFFLGIVICIMLFSFVLNKQVYNIFAALVYGVAVAGYVQVMFMNGSLGVMDAEVIDWGSMRLEIVINALIWIAIILVCIWAVIKHRKVMRSFIKWTSAALIIIQIAAVVFLFVKIGGINNTPGKTVSEYYLSAQEEFSVSENNNIIVFVLDTFSNDFYDTMVEYYPQYMDKYKDFTYYSNYNPLYDGTALAMSYILTGCDFDTSVSCVDSVSKAFSSAKTGDFYSNLKDSGYECRLYSDDDTMSWVDCENLNGIFDNVKEDEAPVASVNKYGIFSKLLTASMYKMVPMGVKRFFLVSTADFDSMVETGRNSDANLLRGADFQNYVDSNGLTVKNTEGLYSIYHFEGMHDYSVKNKHSEEYDIILADKAKENLENVWSYIERLKELDLYDSSTIIITADHGVHEDINGIQPIFFIKEAYADNDSLKESKAMVSVENFMPTIMNAAGYDFSQYGRTVFDYSEDEEIERAVYLKIYDEDYPSVKNSYGLKSRYNCLYKYLYTGDKEELRKRDIQEPDDIILLTDFWY
jgi:hypothetical protein